MDLSPGFALAQLLTGLANASSLFLIASGLSIIFGVTRVVNFAHGSLYMLGAYLAYTLVTTLGGVVGFWAGVLLAAAVVALIGAAVEVLILRRVYGSPELFQLVATFGVVLVVQDAVLAIWGAEDLLGPRAPLLDGAVRILGEPIPEYDLALIAIGPVVLGAIWLLFQRTRWGILVRAATEDREMVGALGVNQRVLFTTAFMVGSFLAGLGGALQVPRESVNLLMDLTIIAEAFVVVVVGGMGSVTGAFVAAVIISVANAFGVLVLPQISLLLPFLVMGIVLIVRPYGLFGTPASAHGASVPEAPLRTLPPIGAGLLAAAVVAAALVPVVDPGRVALATDLLVAVLFAASLHLLMGVGGMVSFGHAAYFGLGAYGAALAASRLDLAMLPAMAVGPVAAAAGAALFGWFCVRLSGVYLAMLTLAAAQIVWGTAFQWHEVTGGDDGILGVWPDRWASDRTVYYLLALAIVVGGLAAIRRLAHSPFGYVLRGGRDSALRAEAIGIDLRSHQWLGFVIAGTLAGLAGAVFAFAKGSVFPDTLAIAQSVDGLIMVLLGGVQSLLGPLLGASAFVLIEDWVTRLEHWRVIFGAIILLIVLAAPDGIAGAGARLWAAIAGRREAR
ncbi:ABC transporter permease [Acuticoccus sp.]|uniref:ABC transporter permease n=1 Tax=Acuticoccus sp. TaxID=1904378 RepID=UPI003B51D193